MGVQELFVAGTLVATGILTGVLAALGWRQGNEAGADWFTATMAANTVWIGTDLGTLLLESELGVVLADRGSTTLTAVVPVLWFCFVLAYTGREELLDRRGLGVVWTIPAVVVAAILTSSYHDFYYRQLAVTVQSGQPSVVSQPGPLAWVNLVYFAVLVVVGLWLLARMLSEHDHIYSRQAVWLLVGTLAPVGLLGTLLALGESEQFPALSLGFTALGLAYAHSLFNHRLFDLSPASRRIGIDEAFDSLGEGVVVATTGRDVVAINDRACRLFDRRKDAVLGEPLEDVSSVFADVDPSEDPVDVETGGRVLAVSVSRVQDARNRHRGWAFVVRDVTPDRRRQQRLDVLSRVFRHNIRNTMNAVVGPTAVLAERLEGTDAESAAVALSAGETVVALSEKVRAIERMMTGSVDPVEVPLDEFLDDAVGSVRNEVPFTVERDVPSDSRVRTDPTVLSVVFKNVLENAAIHSATDDAAQTRTDSSERDATVGESPAGEPDSGRPTGGVDADRMPPSRETDTDREPPREPHVRVAVEDRDGGCLVHVSDDGPGIPPAELDVLRSGVETALEHASGVGLWAIHWGMSRLSGAVRFEHLDRGTRVSLWVPDLDDGATVPPTDSTDGDVGEWFGRPPSDRPAADGQPPDTPHADESTADEPST